MSEKRVPPNPVFHHHFTSFSQLKCHFAGIPPPLLDTPRECLGRWLESQLPGGQFHLGSLREWLLRSLRAGLLRGAHGMGRDVARSRCVMDRYGGRNCGYIAVPWLMVIWKISFLNLGTCPSHRWVNGAKWRFTVRLDFPETLSREDWPPNGPCLLEAHHVVMAVSESSVVPAGWFHSEIQKFAPKRISGVFLRAAWLGCLPCTCS